MAAFLTIWIIAVLFVAIIALVRDRYFKPRKNEPIVICFDLSELSSMVDFVQDPPQFTDLNEVLNLNNISMPSEDETEDC